MSRKRTTSIFLRILIIGGLFSLCFLPSAWSEIKEVDLIVTNVGFNPVFYPIDNKKVPLPAGIKVNLKTASHSQAELYTLATPNKPLVGILSNVNIGKAYTHGMIFKIIAPYYREIVGPDGRSMGQLVVAKDSAIKTPKDLYGRKVAIQGEADGSTIALKTVLKNNYNLDLSQINFVGLENEIMPELLRRGDIDAAMFESDYILTSRFDQMYRTLVDFGKDLKAMYGVVPPAKFFVVRKDLYDQDPELYEKTVQYFRDNYQWSLDHLEEICQLESAHTGEDYQIIMKHMVYESRLDSLTAKDVEAFQYFYQMAFEAGIIEQIPDLNVIFEIKEK